MIICLTTYFYKIDWICYNTKYNRIIEFIIGQKKHKYFKRKGNDLHWTCLLNKKQLNKGVNITIKTPLEGEHVSISTKDKNLNDGNIMTLTGKGMPIKNTNNRGNLIITFKITDKS